MGPAEQSFTEWRSINQSNTLKPWRVARLVYRARPTETRKKRKQQLKQKKPCFRLLLIFHIHISQGSVATHLRCDEIFNDRFIANFSPSLMVEEFGKSVNIWWSYGQESIVSRFLKLTLYYNNLHISISQLLVSYLCTMRSHNKRPPAYLPVKIGRYNAKQFRNKQLNSRIDMCECYMTAMRRQRSLRSVLQVLYKNKSRISTDSCILVKTARLA